jgi:TolA-binding protein
MRKWLPLLIVLLLAAAQGCKKEITVLPPPPVPERTPPETNPSPEIPSQPLKPEANKPAPPVITAPLRTQLDQGETYFREGKFSLAVKELQNYLNSNSELADKALFHLGMSRALNSKPDMSGAKRALQKIVSDYPRSGYREEAEFILRLIAQVEKLQTDLTERNATINRLQEELNRLKEIDMNRRPSRPTEQ